MDGSGTGGADAGDIGNAVKEIRGSKVEVDSHHEIKKIQMCTTSWLYWRTSECRPTVV